MRMAAAVELNPEQRRILERRARGRSLPARVVERARLVLLAADGLENKQIHMIVDNYATHKHPRVQRWLDRHPRFHMHFTPTGCSWLNMVERFFRDLTENRLRRGVFRSVEELIQAVFHYIDQHNDNPKPFIWTAKAADILEKVKRARATLHNRQSA